MAGLEFWLSCPTQRPPYFTPQCFPQVAETEYNSHLSQGFLGFRQMKGFERQANPWQGAGTGHPCGDPELILCSLRASHTRLAWGPLVVGMGAAGLAQEPEAETAETGGSACRA